MTVSSFEDRVPIIGKECFVHPSADVIGKVTMGDHCYVGPGARVRGDYGEIVMGDYASIEENCVVHARPDEICKIGSHTTIGHGAILHNCTIKDWAVIGMGSIVSDYAVVGVWSVVGEGAVVKNNSEVPDGKVVVGVPAKVIADTTDEYKELWTRFKGMYADLAKRYPKGLKNIEEYTSSEQSE